jgi:hypothetical protein
LTSPVKDFAALLKQFFNRYIVPAIPADAIRYHIPDGIL